MMSLNQPPPLPAGNWDTFNKLAKETLQHKPMSKEALRLTFLDIEDLIKSGIGYLLHTTTFVEDNLCYLLSEIAAGVIKSRKIYKGKRVRRRVMVGDANFIEMGSENRRILGIGFDLYKLSRMERSHSVAFVKRIIRTLHISTNVYETMLSSFLKESSEYCRISDELSDLTIQYNRAKYYGEPSEVPTDEILRRISNYMDELSSIEVNTGCVEPNYMYGTVRAISLIMRRVRILQERVLRAYSRLVLKPVREKARSEMEAFDLFQSGNLGLHRSISLYDVWSGTSFPTFANWWIRQRIFGSTKRSSPLIKLPGSVWEMYQKIKAAERQLDSDPSMSGKYTVQDIAERLGTSVKSVERVLRKIQSTKVVSLDSLVHQTEDGHEDEAASERILVDDSDTSLLSRSHVASLERILKYVDTVQRNVVCLRYGIIEAVDNSRIDRRQVLREIFRQTAGKAFNARLLAQADTESAEFAHRAVVALD